MLIVWSGVEHAWRAGELSFHGLLKTPTEGEARPVPPLLQLVRNSPSPLVGDRRAESADLRLHLHLVENHVPKHLLGHLLWSSYQCVHLCVRQVRPMTGE
jgi:hypothetical protein